MRKVENSSEDKLKLWMNAGEIAKAPEGFSSKVMSHIYMEAKPVVKAKSFNMPIAFASLFILLALAALLFVPESNITVKQITIPWEFSISIPEVTTPEFTLPNIVIYLICGFAAIALFDSALWTVFKRKV